jgi:hypothetical protein
MPSNEPEIDSADPDRSDILEESPSKRQRLLEISAYWPKSPEAYYLFRPRGYHDNRSSTIAETPQEALDRRILLLQSVHSHEDNWRNVVVGRDADNFCTRTEIANIRQRATFLCCAYQLALKK